MNLEMSPRSAIASSCLLSSFTLLLDETVIVTFGAPHPSAMSSAVTSVTCSDSESAAHATATVVAVTTSRLPNPSTMYSAVTPVTSSDSDSAADAANTTHDATDMTMDAAVVTTHEAMATNDPTAMAAMAAMATMATNDPTAMTATMATTAATAATAFPNVVKGFIFEVAPANHPVRTSTATTRGQISATPVAWVNTTTFNSHMEFEFGASPERKQMFTEVSGLDEEVLITPRVNTVAKVHAAVADTFFVQKATHTWNLSQQLF